MRKIYGFVLFLVLFLFPLYGFSSHIVGGALTYVYNGGTSYTVTLKLYRDCAAGNAAFDNTVTIQCQQADGSEFSPSRDFVLSTITTVSVTPVPPPCSTAPATAPCVEERTYRATVNLANAPGGMHLYWGRCCRNLGIDNLVAPSDSYGETFYAFIPGYKHEWIEGFSGLANNTTSDAGATSWTRTLGSTAPNYASVQSQVFEVSGANNSSITWTSGVINIASYSSVNLSANLSESGTLDANDSIKVFYSLNGGAYTLFTTNGEIANDFTSAVASQTGLSGSTVQIKIYVKYDASSPTSELYRWDMVSVYDNTFLSNSNPVFNQVPPLYFCQTYQDTIDYSATDANGDSLVYSFYTPYDDVTPTFSENIASFTLVPWQTGYSATSPLNSGGPSLSINSATGQVSGIANTLGKYVFGIRCSEYRNGVLLSSVVRGYQVTTVSCPPFVPPTPTASTSSPSPICTGQTLSLAASTIAGATGYTWSGPNSFSSTLQNPTISNVTTSASGTYSVSATVTGCTGAAGTVSITVNPTPASPTAGSNTPVCSGQTLSLTANTVAGSTYNWNGPNSFSSSTQNPTISNVTTSASGTYTVTRSSAAGCVSTNATTSVTINQTPNAPTASSNSPVCTGSTISLTASNTGTTYSWTGPNSFSSASQNPTIGSSTTANNGTYSVTATTNGCTGTSGTTSVTVNAIPATPTPGSNSPVCVGAVLSLTSNTISGATYNWNGPNSFSSSSQNPSFTPASTASNGTYSVSV
ncbi:MAG TPA: hypothetical protein VFL70_08975, partial [Bacteroidia bacterium]|nr:hypothetical protein [Bacteroidia bacterium]